MTRYYSAQLHLTHPDLTETYEEIEFSLNGSGDPETVALALMNRQYPGALGEVESLIVAWEEAEETEDG